MRGIMFPGQSRVKVERLDLALRLSRKLQWSGDRGADEAAELVRACLTEAAGGSRLSTSCAHVLHVAFQIELHDQLVMAEDGVSARVYLGHSLGQVSSLCCAGAYSPVAALAIALDRAIAIEEGRPDYPSPSAMVAVSGIDRAAVEALCSRSRGRFELAAWNGDGASVLAGERAAVRSTARELMDGGRLATVLPLDYPSHTHWMKGAESVLRSRLRRRDDELRLLAHPAVLSGARSCTISPAPAAADLAAQLSQCVEWSRMVKVAIERGARSFLDLSGSSLSRAASEINPGLPIDSVVWDSSGPRRVRP